MGEIPIKFIVVHPYNPSFQLELDNTDFVWIILAIDPFFLFFLPNFSIQIEAHVGSVNDLAFSYPNKQLCLVTCGEDRVIKVCFSVTFR